MINEVLREELKTFGFNYIFYDEKYDNIESIKKCLLEPQVKEERSSPDHQMLEDIIIKIFKKDSNDIISNVIVKVLKNFYHIKKEENDKKMYLCETPPLLSKHPGLGNIYSYFETNDYVIITSQYSKHSLLSVIRFHANTLFLTPTLGRFHIIGSKDIRMRFLIFQLLQILSYLHENDMVADISDPGKIMVDDAMWLSIPMSTSNAYIISDILKTKESKHESFKEYNNNLIIDDENDAYTDDESNYNNNLNSILKDLYSSSRIPISRHIDYYSPLTTQWISRKISNFEYLISINYAAGRSMLDPLYHPIFPWVTDFSSDCLLNVSENFNTSGDLYRDLSKTKFRLSKGDAQLETTFLHSDPPHHVPESLSELTYYIYMARRTPLQVLRRVVRDVFVPEHYPHSIARMYDWSPDECIPEFFFDLNVFESLHKDLGLPDLELPVFAPTASEFIAYHRSVLESDEVSSKLHLWIDITFGHRLVGDEAVRNLNVPLKQTLSTNNQLGEFASNTKHPGFCILFKEPHPRRRIEKKISNSYFSLSSEKLDIGFGDRQNFFLNELDAFLQLDNKESRVRLRSSSNETSNMQQRASQASILEGGNSLSIEASPIKMYLDQMDDTKFSLKYRKFLEPYYGQGINLNSSLLLEDAVKCENKFTCWDKEFQNNFLRNLDFHNRSVSSHLPLDHSIGCNQLKKMQSEDMFALGCIISEMLTNEPLLSTDVARNILSDTSGLSSLHHAYLSIPSVPLTFRRLIATLIQPICDARPTAVEILQACSTPDHDLWFDKQYGAQQSGGSEQMYVLFESDASTSDLDTRQNKNVDLLHAFCGSIFPCYFKQVYQLIGRLKLCYDGLKKVRLIRNNLEMINLMPLEGVGLALPHLLNILGDPSPFRSNEIVRRCSKIHDDGNQNNKIEIDSNITDNCGISLDDVILDYPLIIDVLGARLGLEDSELLLAPRILNFLQKIMSPKMLEKLLVSKLWQVIVIRMGVPCFLRVFLPLLLTYLVSGNLFLLTKSNDVENDVSPLWAVLGKTENSEWLHNCSLEAINCIQKAAVQAVVKLCDPEVLGPGLCARYVVPALMCLVGLPNLAVTGFSSKNTSESIEKFYESESDGDVIEEFIINGNSYKPDVMFCTRAVALICCKLKEAVTSEVVLQKIFACIIPQIIEKNSSNSTPYLASLMEITFLLNGILPSLSTDVVQRAYLQIGSSGISLPKLLLSVPLSPILSIHDDENELTSSTLNYYIIVQRRYLLLLEISRLLVSVAMIVGPVTTISHILPSIDEFFSNFVDLYGRIPINSVTMMKALELGADLYTPLTQLTGPEAFSTAVSSVNPRLEMWLASIGSGGERTSPPLPSSILPENSETSSILLQEPEAGKYGGFRAWVMSKAKEMVSSTPMTARKSAAELKFTPFTTALDRSRLRTGAQSVIKSATEGMELQEFDNSIIMPTPQNLFQALSDNVENNDHDEPADLLATSIVTEDLDITMDSAEGSVCENDTKGNQKGRTRTSSNLVEQENKVTNEVVSSSLTLSYRSIYENDNDNLDDEANGYPSSFYKRLIYSKTARQITNANKMNKKKMGLLKAVSNRLENELNNDDDKEDAIENEMTWLLSGTGRWNIKMELEAKERVQGLGLANITNYSKKINFKDLYMPAAQISTTSPRINVDAAYEANEIFSLNLSNKWQYVVDEGNPIASMIVNSIESLLVTGSKSGIRLWSLNSYPIRQVSKYSMHSSAPFCMGFLKNGTHIASCDGNINIWDIEKKDTVAFLSAPDKGFTHMHVASCRSGINCGLGICGDDQIVTCSGSTVSFYDFRFHSPKRLKGVSEWNLPLPGTSNHFSLSNQEIPTLTCVTTSDLYTFVGSSWGVVFVVDKRVGKIFSTWQCTDQSQGAVVKVEQITNSTVLCVQEKAITVWEFKKYNDTELSSLGVPRKVLTLKDGPHSGINMSSNNIIISSFDQQKERSPRNSVTVPQNVFDDSMNKSLSVLYCVNGNKIFTAQLPKFDNIKRDNGFNLAGGRDNFPSLEMDEIKLSKNNFTDSNNGKVINTTMYLIFM